MQRIPSYYNKIDKISGCMIGGAIGDALGYPVEFLTIDQIKAQYGPKGITSFSLENGKALISDDTQMSLFTANGLIFYSTRGAMRGIAAEPHCYVVYAYKDWLRTQTESYKEREDSDGNPNSGISWLLNEPKLFSRRAPGMTCLSALQKIDPNKVEDIFNLKLNDSKGCGGIMRTAPCALFNERNNDEEASKIAALTHSHPLGYMPSAILNHILTQIVHYEKRPLEEVVKESVESVRTIFGDNQYWPELENIINKACELSHNDRDDLTNITEIGQGWVAEETLAIAIYCSLRHKNDFSAGIIAAVNHSGDSDSTGAVTGNILGAICGYDNIDLLKRWHDLELLHVIWHISEDLAVCNYLDEGVDRPWIEKYVHCKWKIKEPINLREVFNGSKTLGIEDLVGYRD